MTRSILGWLESPSARRGVRVARGRDEWEWRSYAELARDVHQVAHGLIEARLRRGQHVPIVAEGGFEFIAALFGSLLAGGTPAPMPVARVFQPNQQFVGAVAARVTALEASLVLADEASAAVLREERQLAHMRVLGIGDLARGTARNTLHEAREPATLALLQFTSGSTGASRAVRVPASALDSNVAAIHSWLGWSDSDVFVSWLPVHHDMGLVGGVICGVAFGSELWLLQPEQFVRHPVRFLRCFGELGATMTTMPGFALQYLARRVADGALEGLDFSRWRVLIAGAERIDAHAIRTFEQRLARFGLRPGTVLPAYGLAEATLGVTGVRPGERWCESSPDRMHDPVVGCGRPLNGVSVSIVDASGQTVPDGEVGEIVVCGDSRAAGYVTGASVQSLTKFQGDQLRTGDAGFRRAGELFVLGRLGDAMKVRGLQVFSEDLEVMLVEAGWPRERLAVLLGAHMGAPTVVCLIGRGDPASLRQVASLLQRRVPDARVIAMATPPAAILRTSSGKPRRRELWDSFVHDRLKVLHTSGAAISVAVR